jgi:hypothetical protein
MSPGGFIIVVAYNQYSLAQVHNTPGIQKIEVGEDKMRLLFIERVMCITKKRRSFEASSEKEYSSRKKIPRHCMKIYNSELFDKHSTEAPELYARTSHL